MAFICLNCGFKFKNKEREGFMISDCKRCDTAMSAYDESSALHGGGVHLQDHRGLSEWEVKKLGWYRNEKKWHEDIDRRSIAYKNGKKYQVYRDREGKITGEIPKPPLDKRKKPTNWQPGYSSNSERIDKKS